MAAAEAKPATPRTHNPHDLPKETKDREDGPPAVAEDSDDVPEHDLAVRGGDDFEVDDDDDDSVLSGISFGSMEPQDLKPQPPAEDGSPARKRARVDANADDANADGSVVTVDSALFYEPKDGPPAVARNVRARVRWSASCQVRVYEIGSKSVQFLVAAAEAKLASPRTRNPKRERQESEAVLRPAKRVRREVQTVEPQQRARVRWSATCQRREYDVGSKSYEFLTGTCPLRRLRSL